MNVILLITQFIIGLGLIIYFAEKLVKGVIGTSLGFGLSAFLISVIFIGFDPENLAVGSVASYEEVAGIALGSVIGAAMVAIALALGITALVVPLKFEDVPKRILIVPNLSIILFGALAIDGRLSRPDGLILMLGFIYSVIYLLRLNRKGYDIKAKGEISEALTNQRGASKINKMSKWNSLLLFVVSLVAILIGSELVVRASKSFIQSLGISETFFGMTILAFLVSIEELARELPAAIKKRADISFGNVVGSILAFFLFNAGIIALVRPVEIDQTVLYFYLPMALITTIVISLFMLTKKISRVGGLILVLLYLVFITKDYIIK